ncbi:MAG: hypothetical protein A4E19_13930 [Nitrospira sp. SG-bin1]|nr:MAG: hypothetical protein A4E19_13930 [Nitrospira sp. SG-bin1]
MNASFIALVTITVGILVSSCTVLQKARPGSTMSNAEILGLLETINRSEIDAGQLAKQKASGQEVRSYATRMIDEHQMMMRDLNRLADFMELRPQKPALAFTMENEHQDTMEELRDKSGSDFDQAYKDYQVKMHRQAVDVVQNAVDSVKNFNIKQHLRQARPNLQDHLASAQSIEQ